MSQGLFSKTLTLVCLQLGVEYFSAVLMITPVAWSSALPASKLQEMRISFNLSPRLSDF